MGRSEEELILSNALDHIASYGTAPPDATHLIDVGSAEYLEYFKREVIGELISTGGATVKFFEGTYGSGKSHTLQLLKELSLKQGMVVTSIDLSMALSLSDWDLITTYILQNMEADIEGQRIRSLPEILVAWGRTIDPCQISKLRAHNLPTSGFKSAMIYALQREQLSDPTWEVVKQYLLGRKMKAITIKQTGLSGLKGNLTKKNAEYVLKTILGGLYSLGFTGSTLLFDENEKTLVSNSRIPSKKNQIAANLMRRVIDGCSNGFMIGTIAVFAVLPGFLEGCSMSYPALGQRLQINRNDMSQPSWRWPVLPITNVNLAKEPEDFLEQAIDSYIGIVKNLGGKIDGLQDLMLERGQKVLETNVGAGYRRELVKTLANLSVGRVWAK